MTAAIRLEVAREKVAEMSVETLKRYFDSDECWFLARRVGVAFDKLERLIRQERFKRGDLKLSDLPPHIRRELIDPARLDLKAIAAGPIMDSNELYLPAGKLSMAETRAREAAALLGAEMEGERG